MVPYGTAVEFTLARIEVGQWQGSDEYEVAFEAPEGSPWVAYPGNSDLEDYLYYDINGNPPDTSGLKWKFAAVKMEMITPGGDPVQAPVDGGDGSGAVTDGANELTFSTAATGVLTLKLKARVTPSGLADLVAPQCTFSAEGIGSSTMAWGATSPEGVPCVDGGYLEAMVIFTGLPANNGDFGPKMAAIKFAGHPCDESHYEVFYSGEACNHPDAATENSPNWFHYYRQVEGGTDYGYMDCAQCNHFCIGGVHRIEIGDSAYGESCDIATEVVGGQRIAVARTESFRGLRQFMNAVAHEREHGATCPECPPSIGTDTDGDGVTDLFEYNSSATDPAEPHSARDLGTLDDIKTTDYYNDGELWSRHKGILAARATDASRDWADGGCNHVP
jgi:hypothetical protein